MWHVACGKSVGWCTKLLPFIPVKVGHYLTCHYNEVHTHTHLHVYGHTLKRRHPSVLSSCCTQNSRFVDLAACGFKKKKSENNTKYIEQASFAILYVYEYAPSTSTFCNYCQCVLLDSGTMKRRVTVASRHHFNKQQQRAKRKWKCWVRRFYKDSNFVSDVESHNNGAFLHIGRRHLSQQDVRIFF